MGMLDGLIGGAVGAGLAVAASRIIESHGGVQGVINQMQTHGLGETVRSGCRPGRTRRFRPSKCIRCSVPARSKKWRSVSA